MPTNKNNAPVDTPWLIIWIVLPDIDCVVKAKMPSTMKPIWATDEYATNRLRSICIVAAMAP